MRVPSILSSGNVKTGAVGAPRVAFQGPGAAPQASFTGAEAQAAAGRSIGGGLMDLAGGINRRIQIDESKRKERANYDNHLWSESQYTGAQREWIQWTDDVQKNGSENVVEQFKEKFTKYQEEILATAPNEDARNRLKLKLDDLGTRVFDSSLKIEANNRVKNTVNTFTQMLEDTTDIVVKDPLLAGYPISELFQNLKQAYDNKRIPEETYLKLKEHVNNLSAVQAEAAATKDPEFARVVIENAEGIDWARRKAVLNTIERAEQSNDSLAKYELHELFKSHVDSIMETGEGVAGFSAASYAQALPKEQRAAAMAEVQSKVEIAKTIFVGKTQMLGKTPGQVAETLNTFKPEAGDPKFNDKQAVYQKLAELADNQVKLFQKDPFSYSRQDPVVHAAWDLVEQLPEGTKPELVHQLTQQALDASINFQRQSGIPEGRLSAMSQAAASQMAERINKGDVKQVQDSLAQLQGTYGKYYPQAFRDMVRLPEGQRIDAAVQIVALHVGKPFLADFLASVRTPASDMKIDTKDAQQLRDSLITNPQFMAFKGAMLSANPGAVSQVNDFHQAIDKYATSLIFRGKVKNSSDAVKQATELVIGSAYGFTTVEGTPVAVKREVGGATFNDDNIATIGQALGQFQKTIAHDKIDVSRFAFPEGITDETRTRSIQNTILHDAFWVTNSQNDGAVLYMNGMNGSTAPIKWKDGRQVEAKFSQALNYGRGINRRHAETHRPWYMPAPIITGIGY